jgi:hypothetical protein
MDISKMSTDELRKQIMYMQNELNTRLLGSPSRSVVFDSAHSAPNEDPICGMCKGVGKHGEPPIMCRLCDGKGKYKGIFNDEK